MHWYTSKTKWAGIIWFVSQIVKLIAVPEVAALAPALEGIAGALGAFGIKNAIEKSKV